MKKRLRDVIDLIDDLELQRIRDDLSNGGLQLKKFVEDQIHFRESQKVESCAMCTAEINPESTSTFTLTMGPVDFKKKASFCGKDCLEYFLKQLDEMKAGHMPKTIVDE